MLLLLFEVKVHSAKFPKFEQAPLKNKEASRKNRNAFRKKFPEIEETSMQKKNKKALKLKPRAFKKFSETIDRYTIKSTFNPCLPLLTMLCRQSDIQSADGQH